MVQVSSLLGGIAAACLLLPVSAGVGTGLTDWLKPKKPFVTSKALRATVKESALFKRGQKLQDIAYATPERNRLTGTLGHNNSVKYIHETLKSLGDYYDITLEPLNVPFSSGNATLITGSTNQNASLMSYSPAGTATAEIAVVPNVGCSPVRENSSRMQG